MVTAGIFPFKENSHGRAGNRTRDLMISSQRLWPLDHEAGHIYNNISEPLQYQVSWKYTQHFSNYLRTEWTEKTGEAGGHNVATCICVSSGRLQLKCDGTRWRTGGKWRGNWRMEWVASTLHTTSEHGVSRINTANAHTSAASSRLNWRPPPILMDSSFRRKTKSGFCAYAITFQLASSYLISWRPMCICLSALQAKGLLVQVHQIDVLYS